MQAGGNLPVQQPAWIDWLQELEEELAPSSAAWVAAVLDACSRWPRHASKPDGLAVAALQQQAEALLAAGGGITAAGVDRSLVPRAAAAAVAGDWLQAGLLYRQWHRGLYDQQAS